MDAQPGTANLDVVPNTTLPFNRTLENPAAARSVRPGRSGRILKRMLDLAIALPGLLLLAPLFFLIAVLIRWRLGSPVFFRQLRSGQFGRPFRIWKFRTMTDSRGPEGRLLPDEHRLTAVGEFLRRYSLDELPQLINVLTGEMSLVGPRPLLLRYNERYSPRQRLRLEAIPGITGWAQVHGRNQLDWESRLELDAWYVEHQCLRLDLKILALTFAQLFRRKNSPEPDREEFWGAAVPPPGSPLRNPADGEGN